MNWHKNHSDSRSFGDRTADWIASHAFSWASFWTHTIWWLAWFALRLNVDFLTLVVSLEAIMLCIFIGMSQDRQGERDRHQAEADYRTNIEAKIQIDEHFALTRAQDEKLDAILTEVRQR